MLKRKKKLLIPTNRFAEKLEKQRIHYAYGMHHYNQLYNQ